MATTRNLILAAPLTEKPTTVSSIPATEILTPPSSPPPPQNSEDLRREDFIADVPDFLFGTGTGSYQVEGAAFEDGKGISVWDDWTLRNPGQVGDGGNGNVACDMYHRYKEDIKAMKRLGFDAYRFSLSWTRILPGGRPAAGINRKGIDYYNDLIDTVIKNGLKPCVTLFHWDLPAMLEKEYDGFLNKDRIKEDFLEYVELCFFEFGDRVKWWTTLNEPWTYAIHGYVRGIFPPGETAPSIDGLQNNLQAYRSNQHTTPKESIKVGTITRPFVEKDVYTVTRNLLLCHAAAVHLYRTKFKDVQKGEIGIVLNSHWHVPYSQHITAEGVHRDADACTRAIDFMLGWFLDPILRGHYPESMQANVPPDDLAGFSKKELELLQNSIDYLGLNYYTTNYAQDYDFRKRDAEMSGYIADQRIQFRYRSKEHGKLIGEPSGSDWLYVVPWGIYQHLQYFVDTYKDLPSKFPPIYITENGTSQASDHTLIAKDVCADAQRKKYHQDHLYYIKQAMDDFKGKLEIKGYFVWSWCDNFEWAEGYNARFGINYIDYKNNQTRYPKSSAMWFAQFLKGGRPSKVMKIEGPAKKRHFENDDHENEHAEKRARGGED